MNKCISLPDKAKGFLRRFTRADDGSTAIEFAFILPILLLFTIGIMEFGLILFDYHRAGEATRRAMRTAMIEPPLANLDTLTGGGSVVCTGSGGGVSCTGGTVEGTADASFNVILAKMRNIFSAIEAENVQITYSPSGLDAALSPGLTTPLITVDLKNLTRPYIVLDFLPAIGQEYTFPPFSTTVVDPPSRPLSSLDDVTGRPHRGRPRFGPPVKCSGRPAGRSRPIGFPRTIAIRPAPRRRRAAGFRASSSARIATRNRRRRAACEARRIGKDLTSRGRRMLRGLRGRRLPIPTER